MNNRKEQILKTKNYYVNIDYKIINTYLTKQQMALIVFIHKLSTANLTATNREIASFLGTTSRGTNIKTMIDNINSKTDGLIEVRYDTPVNHLGKIKSEDKDIYSRGRSLHLTRPLFTKGQRYINIPSFVYENTSHFLSSNELKVLGHIKSMQKDTFKGFLSIFARGAKVSLGILRRSLKRLVSLKALSKSFIKVHHKLKNIYYTVNVIRNHSNWQYVGSGKPRKVLKRNVRKDLKSDDEEWSKILENVGTL